MTVTPWIVSDGRHTCDSRQVEAAVGQRSAVACRVRLSTVQLRPRLDVQVRMLTDIRVSG